MLCQRCKQNEATIHATKIINGSASEEYLCAQCAQKGITLAFSANQLFKPFFGVQEGEACPCCHTTLEELRKTGLAGCSECYSTFREALMPAIRQVQGADRHIGKCPPQERLSAMEVKRKELRAALEQAIAEEEYERAAELRDELAAL